MTSWHDNFAARVDYARDVIARGARTSRRFDSCFEQYDGDEVAVALLRRARAHPESRLAKGLWRYLDRLTVECADKELADVADLAKRSEEKRKAERDRCDAMM